MSNLFEDAADLLARVAIEEWVSNDKLIDTLHRSAQDSSNSSLHEKACDLLIAISHQNDVDEKNFYDILYHSILNAIRRSFGKACIDRREDEGGFYTSSLVNIDLPRFYDFIRIAYKNVGVELERPKTRSEAIDFFKNLMKNDPYCEMDDRRFPVYHYYDYNLNVVLSECSFEFLWNDDLKGDEQSVDDIPF